MGRLPLKADQHTLIGCWSKLLKERMGGKGILPSGHGFHGLQILHGLPQKLWLTTYKAE